MKAEKGRSGYVASALRVRDMPARLRPREAFERLGAEHVSDAVLLALILRTGVPGLNVIDAANRLLAAFGSLTAMARASTKELQAIEGIGPVKAQMIKAAMELAQRLAREGVGERPTISSPDRAAALLRERARTLRTETFWALMLDVKNRLLGEPRDLSRGTLDRSLVHPRELFAEALRLSAASVLLVHNHPSGDPTPSREDVEITRRLVEAGKLMGIRVLDHVVLGRRRVGAESDFVSLRESGDVRFE